MSTRSGVEKHFPEAFNEFEFVTVFDLLIRYIKEGRIRLDKSKFAGIKATYHDPCNYGRKSQRLFGHAYYEEPRWIMDQCIDDWVEMYPTRENQLCCGGGGGTPPTGYHEERFHYARWKAESIKATGADMLVVPCHSCHGQFNAMRKKFDMEYLQVKYLWEVVADCLVV